jgi:hypothetical protein
MRLLVVSVAAALLLGQDNYQFTDPNVQDMFRYARMAFGSDVSKIKTLQLKGRSKVDFGGSLIECTVDIKMLLPNNYLRVDSTATDEKLAGYTGKNVLNAIRSGPNLSIPPDNLTSTILKNEQLRQARLLLGAATYATPEFALIFRAVGMTGGAVDPRVSPKTSAYAEGRGVPNQADISSSTGFRARILFDASRMPSELVYATGAQDETMKFEDRRDVAGFKLPFHITTSAGGRVIDELRLEQILVNPEIGKGDFKR